MHALANHHQSEAVRHMGRGHELRRLGLHDGARREFTAAADSYRRAGNGPAAGVAEQHAEVEAAVHDHSAMYCGRCT